MICFTSGLTDDSSTPETPCEENDPQMSTSSREKNQAFVQDCLDAHEELLSSQSTQGLCEHQPNSENLEAEQPGQGLKKELLEKDRGKTLEADDTKHPNQSFGMQRMRNATQIKYAEMSQQLEMKQLPLVRPVHLKADDAAPACGPGPLVTEIEDAEQLETIYLPPQRTLRTDDLPDLEDVDAEDLTATFSSQQAFKPKIEVISGDTDEDEPTGNQSEGNADEKSFFSLSGCFKSTGVCAKSSSLVYPEDEDALEPEGESKPVQTTMLPCCLIEELE